MRPQPMSIGKSAASTTEGMPSRTSGMPKTALSRGDAQIAGGGDLHAGAERIALDAGDDRRVEPAQAIAAAMDARDEGARRLLGQRGHLVDIGAADEGARARAREDDGAQAIEPGERLDLRDEARHQGRAQRVELALIGDRHPSDDTALALLEVDLDLTGRARHRGLRAQASGTSAIRVTISGSMRARL